MARRLTKAEKIARIPDIDISKLKGEEGRKQLIKYVQTLQSGYKRRVASFKRQGEFSYAQDILERSFTPGSKGKISSMSMKQLHMEFARYATFFNAETSNLEGIRKVNRQQDIRIFGVDEDTGRPLQTMDATTRQQYWELYQEYMKQNPQHMLSSEQVQQIIGARQFLPTGEFNLVDRINAIKEELERRRGVEAAQGMVPNAYMGEGPFIAE